MNKEELDVDIVIANEQARVAAGRLASERKDCIAFIGSKFEDVVGLKSAKIVENLIADVLTGELNAGEVANSFCATFGNYKYQYDLKKSLNTEMYFENLFNCWDVLRASKTTIKSVRIGIKV